MRATLDAFAERGEKRPAILEVPSKEHPYEKALDPVYQRTKLLLGLRD
jgi:vacuolar-type H+-ATPase subunit F/Vma7